VFELVRERTFEQVRKLLHRSETPCLSSSIGQVMDDDGL